MANILSVTLTFRPIMDGLQRFGTAIEQRLERVRALNMRLEHGAQTANTLLASAAAALSGAQLARTLTGLIKSGVDFNAQLEQAKLGIAAVLKQFDQAGRFKTFDDAIRESGEAIDLLKQKAVTSPASFEALVQAFQGTVGPMTAAGIKLRDQVNLIVNMSQALAGLGIRSEQILQETRALITGNINADAAAAKVLGITSADITKAREQGQLYEFLSQRIAAFAEAGERGSRSLETLRSNFGDALQQKAAAVTERLTAALTRLYERLTALVQTRAFADMLAVFANRAAELVGALTHLVDAFSKLGPNAQLALVEIVDLGTTAALVIASLAAIPLILRGIAAAASFAMVPVRKLFVFIAGVDLVDAIRDLQRGSKELGIISKIQLASWGQRAAMALGLVAAAFAGWQLGKFINELEIGGAKVKDWAALVVNSIVGLFEALLAWKDVLKQRAISTATEAMAKLRELYWTGALAIADALNTVLSRFGKSIPTDALRQAITEARAELKQLKADNDAAVAAAEAALARVVTFRGAVGESIADGAFIPPPTAPQSAGEDVGGGGVSTPVNRAQQLEEAKAALDLERLQLEESYDQKIIDLDGYLARRYDLLERALAIEKKYSDKPPGRAAVALAHAEEAAAQARIRRETTAKERQLRLAEAEQALSEKLGELAHERARIEGDQYSTAEQKRPLLLELLRQENALLDEKIKKLDIIIAQELDPEKRLQLRQERESAAQQQAQNDQAIAGYEPQSMGQGMLQGVAGQGGFLDSLGTAAANAASVVKGTLNAALQGTAGLIENLWLRTRSWGEAWRGMLLSVGQAFSAMIAEMIARIIFRYTIEAALRKLGLIDAIATNKAIVADEAITAGLMKVIWAPIALLKSIATGGTAAIIGVAALLAAVAAFGGFRANGGDAKAGKAYVVGDGGVPELFVPDQDGYIFPRVPDFGAALAGGMARPEYGGSGAAGAGGAAGGGDSERMNITVINVTGEREATRIARQSAARGDIVRIVREDFGIPPRNG